MNISRPFTAFKENRTSKIETKMLTHVKRPLSAKSDSLKKIIQVIEDTLSRGANTIQKKVKTMDKFSKLKNQSMDFMHHPKLFKPTIRYNRDFPQFQTEFIISNTVETHKSTPYIKSTKKIFTSFDSDDFVPYMKQKTDAQEPLKKEKVTLKKMTKNRISTKECEKQALNTINFNQIDKWENESSIINLSYLLDKEIS